MENLDYSNLDFEWWNYKANNNKHMDGHIPNVCCNAIIGNKIETAKKSIIVSEIKCACIRCHNVSGGCHNERQNQIP